MTIEVLDPSWGEDRSGFVAAPRLATLEGVTVGIISNGKRGTIPFFSALEAELRSTYAVGQVVHVTKPNYSAPAGDEILDRAREWNALVSGIGD